MDELVHPPTGDAQADAGRVLVLAFAPVYAGFEGTPGGSDEPPGVCALGNADDVHAAVGVFENPGENVWLVCAVGEADACALTVYDE